MKQRYILIMLHCEQHTGYAIGTLERVFEAAALSCGFPLCNILWSYTKVSSPGERIYELGYFDGEDAKKLKQIHNDYPIETILAFDLPYPTVLARQARKLGVMNIVSYWGASMSSLNTGVRLLAKKLEWYLRIPFAPTMFIFESEAMRLTAVSGRGIPKDRTKVIHLGVDTNVFRPCVGSKHAHRELGIPVDRKIIFFSGHMEERKGVRVLVESMNFLKEINKIEPFHLLICGNKGSESLPYEALIAEPETKNHITFAGYRDDIPQLMQSSFLGVIASTGWDSFTMSSIEMMSSGLPLIVSNLQGLKETTVPNHTGDFIQPGDYSELAHKILNYYNNPEVHSEHSKNARERVLSQFSVELQVDRLSEALTSFKQSKHFEV
jgi:glycosyltransferase involved in cell wall biosynthesis